MKEYSKQLNQKEVDALATDRTGSHALVVWPGGYMSKTSYRLYLNPDGVPVALTEKQGETVVAGRLDKIEPVFGYT